MKTLKKQILQLLLILGLIALSFQKSTLIIKDASNGNCETENNRFTFYLQCQLTGTLSQSMFRDFKIKSNYNFEPEIECEIPEISDSSSIDKDNFFIKCYVKNFRNEHLSFSFEGESDELEIINERDLNIEIYCQQTIILALGDIEDISHECFFNSYSTYTYKINILNETIPKDLHLDYINLQPTIIRNHNDDEDIHDIITDCFLNNTDYNNHFICSMHFYRNIDATLYYEKDYRYETILNNYNIIIKSKSEDVYFGQEIICNYGQEINADKFTGRCINGIFFFSLNINSDGDKDNDDNSEIFSKLLFEIKAKVDSKIFRNYCYLDNRNEDNKYDISKYKLNCAITSFKYKKLKIQNLFSEFLFLNNLMQEWIHDGIYCYSSQNYITPFYYYYDTCSNNNTFKILSVINFNNDNIIETLIDTIEISIISPFESIAICKLSSLQLEPYIEFNCQINYNEKIDFKNIIFGNMTKNIFYDSKNLIVLNGFEGKKNFGKYCSNNVPKCMELIEKDNGINSMNKNNPQVYKYSFCITSDNNYIFNKDNYNILFNNNSIVNCSITKTELGDDFNKTKAKCLLDEEILDEYPFLKIFNPINYTFYNNIFKDINELTKNVQDISEIDYDLKIIITEVKDYYCLNNNSISLKLTANITKTNSIIEDYVEEFKYYLMNYFLDYTFSDILNNEMNITFVGYYYDYSLSTLEIDCIINGDFSHENNVIVKNDFNYKSFFNNYTIIWEKKTLFENIKCDNNEKITFYEFGHYGDRDFSLIGYSSYVFDFYDNNGFKTEYLKLNVKINGILAENKATCTFPYIYNEGLIKFDIFCEIYDINITNNDIISFEECNETKIKTLDYIELKIEGLDKLYYIYKESYKSKEDTTISIFSSNDPKDIQYCNEHGYFFILTYDINLPIENEDILSQYSINSLINPINNEIIKGNCAFLANDDYYYNSENNYENIYNKKYYLSCGIFSDLIDVPYLLINNNYLDKTNNDLPNIKIFSSSNKPNINLGHSLSCAKNIIFTINVINDKKCLDGTYIFKMYGTLSKKIENNINTIIIRDTIENNIQIFCNNLSFYGNIGDKDYYSFNCYIINDILNDYLNITFLDDPPNSKIISIEYSPYFKNNKMIHFNFKCFNEDRSKGFDDEFNSVMNYIFSLNDNLLGPEYRKEFSYKIMIKIDKYPTKKLDEYYNKYMGNFLILQVDNLGFSFCDLKNKNITKTSIIRCYGNYYYDVGEDIVIYKINSHNIYGDYNNGPKMTFLGLINNNLNEYEYEEEYPKFKVDNISKGCIDGQYIFNISGKFYGKNEEINHYIPKEIEIFLENNLYANCKVFININDKETDLQLMCHLLPNNEIINKDIKFNVSSLKNDDIISIGLLDYISTGSEIIDLNVSCGIVNPIYNNTFTDIIDATDYSELNSDIAIDSSLMKSTELLNSSFSEILSSTIETDSDVDNITSTLIKDYQNNLSSSIIEDYNKSDTIISNTIGDDSTNFDEITNKKIDDNKTDSGFSEDINSEEITSNSSIYTDDTITDNVITNKMDDDSLDSSINIEEIIYNNITNNIIYSENITNETIYNDISTDYTTDIDEMTNSSINIDNIKTNKIDDDITNRIISDNIDTDEKNTNIPINTDIPIITDNIITNKTEEDAASDIISNIPINLNDTTTNKIDDITESSIYIEDNQTYLIIDHNITNHTTSNENQTNSTNLPQFHYHSIDISGCINGSLYININGNMTNYSNTFNYTIETISIKVMRIIYYSTCYSEEIESPNDNYNFRFNCSIKTPPQYFNSIDIYKPSKYMGFELLGWPNHTTITKKGEIICSDYKFSLQNYSDLEICDMNSESFNFEIGIESSLKEGILKNKTILLNISEPSSIDIATCHLSNTNVNSTIKLHCQIVDLNQEKRIINGIKIEGIIINNITDEYLITERNKYIKLIDFGEIQLSNIECPTDFTIRHCKTVNKKFKKCELCHSNYYSDNNECKTCSQLNEGCNSCNKEGVCKKCLNGYDLNENICTNNTSITCEDGRYGSECKECKDINPNCNECYNSGFCKKCDKGYYLSGIDDKSKCLKCLSTCEECDSLNRCTKCKQGFILNINDYSCVSCFSLNEGCEECNKHGKCTKCYDNNNFKYKLKDNKCVKKEEKKEKGKTNLQFGRLDGFEQEDDKIHFKSHFILLDNYLYNSVFYIIITIKVKIINQNDTLRYLRGLEEITSKEEEIICNQYGDSLGNTNDGGYLANFKCTTDLKDNQELLSIEPKKMEIRDNENKTIQDFEPQKVALDVNELSKESLDEEFSKYEFNKISISKISDITLKDNDLSFNIVGNIDSSIKSEKEYEISLKDNNNKKMTSTCYFPILNDVNNQIISCKALIDKQSEISDLSFIQGVYSSKTNNSDKLIFVDNNNLNIKVPENENEKSKKLSTIAIVFISIGAVIFIVGIILIIKCIVLKKKNNIIEKEHTQYKNKNSIPNQQYYLNSETEKVNNAKYKIK